MSKYYNITQAGLHTRDTEYQKYHSKMKNTTQRGR